MINKTLLLIAGGTTLFGIYGWPWLRSRLTKWKPQLRKVVGGNKQDQFDCVKHYQHLLDGLQSFDTPEAAEAIKAMEAKVWPAVGKITDKAGEPVPATTPAAVVG